MNRKLYVGIMSFFAVVFTISINFLPYYNPIYFYLQHISLFLFMAMFIYYLLKLGYDRLQKRVKKTNVLKGYTTTIFVVLLFLFSNVQLYAIETYQTSDYQSCSYYDKYDNAIYYTQLNNQCPDLKILSNKDSELIFTVYEHVTGKSEPGYMIDNDMSYNLEAIMRTDITIAYFADGRIENIETSRSTNIKLFREEEEYKIYNSFKTIVENTRYMDFNTDTVNEFTSNMIIHVLDDIFYDYGNFDNVNHYSGNDYISHYIGYDSKRTDLASGSNVLSFQLIVNKNKYIDDTFTNGESEMIRLYDAYCFSDHCSIQEGNPTDAIQAVEPLLYYNDHYAYIDFYPRGIAYDYQTFHYQDEESPRRHVIYSNYDSYDFIIRSEHTYSDENIFNPGIDRSSFTYLGKLYLEHGELYSIFHDTKYGTKIVSKDSTMSGDDKHNSKYISDIVSSEYGSINEVGVFNSFFKVQYINDYGSRLVTQQSAESIEIIYQNNPLIFELLTFYSENW